MSYVEEDQEKSKFFMTYLCWNDIASDVWFVDSGCSNHMLGKRSMFRELDASHNTQIRFRYDTQTQVEGKGIVAVMVK